MEYCNCEDKQFLEKGDGQFIAEVSVCPTHGFNTSCWQCNSKAWTTELCSRHAQLAEKVSEGNVRRRGKIKVTFEKLEDVLELPESHKIVGVLCDPTDTLNSEVKVVIDGPQMPIQREGEEAQVVGLEDLTTPKYLCDPDTWHFTYGSHKKEPISITINLDNVVDAISEAIIQNNNSLCKVLEV